MIRMQMPTPPIERITECGEKQNINLETMARFIMHDLSMRVEGLGGQLLYKDLSATKDGIYADINVNELPSLTDLIEGMELTVDRFSNQVVKEISERQRVLGAEKYPTATDDDVITPNEDWPLGWLEAYLDCLLWFSMLSEDSDGIEHVANGIYQNMEHYEQWDMETLNANKAAYQRRQLARHKINDKIQAAIESSWPVVINSELSTKAQNLQEQLKANLADDITLLIGSIIDDIRCDNHWFENDAALAMAELQQANGDLSF